MKQENENYNSDYFIDNGSAITYRQSRITPTKQGEFVAFWKRNANGETIPFDWNDPIDYLVIANQYNQAHFKFPHSALVEHGIISSQFKPGKRGFRVYDPSLSLDSTQAKKTQKWQRDYYVSQPYLVPFGPTET